MGALGSAIIALEGTMTSPILRWFSYDHLPPRLREVSAQFTNLARWIDESLVQGPEKSTSLRRLLEAKDAAVRQAILDGEQTLQSESISVEHLAPTGDAPPRES